MCELTPAILSYEYANPLEEDEQRRARAYVPKILHVPFCRRSIRS